MQYKFLEDTAEFFSWKSYGTQQIAKRWQKIKKKVESGLESEYKLAIIEAEDFLSEILDERGFGEEDFEENIKNASRLISSIESQILSAHEIRNSIVYNPDYKIDEDQTKKTLAIYESAVNSIGLE